MSLSEREKENRESRENREWVFVLDIPLMNEYQKYYQTSHPRSKKHPLKVSSKVVNLAPYPLSMNQTMIIKSRPQANALKQAWKNFAIWWCEKLGYDGLMLDGVEIYIEFYFSDKRERDIVDNYNLKYINDGFVSCGFIKDDNCKVIPKAHYIFKCVDREYPRTVIRFVKLKDEEIVE